MGPNIEGSYCNALSSHDRLTEVSRAEHAKVWEWVPILKVLIVMRCHPMTAHYNVSNRGW